MSDLAATVISMEYEQVTEILAGNEPGSVLLADPRRRSEIEAL